MELRISMFLCEFVVLYACVVLSDGHIRDSLNNWETLTVSTIQRRSVKRDTTNAHPAGQLVKFNSFGRHFSLFLRKNLSILAPGFKIFVFEKDGSKSEVQLDLSLYRGSVEGDEDSFVSAYFNDQQVLSATIQTSDETYVVEPASNLIPNSSNETMIIYKGSDLKWDNRSHCGFVSDAENSVAINKSLSVNGLLARPRKATPVCTSVRDTCPLYLSAGPHFVRVKGQNKIKTTVAYLLKSIDFIDKIYRRTEFPGCGKNFGFEVKIMNIFTTPAEGYSYTQQDKRHTYNGFLEEFSKDKELKDVCLGHTFTHQPFYDAGSYVLGLAYMADPVATKLGGVCSKTKRSNRNVGWTTYVGGFDTITDLQGTLVTAHELGHNWGAAHDPDTNEECAPKSSNYGKFIMYPASVSGRDRNNKNFSRCSLMAIGAVLSAKSVCFEERKPGFCGNHIVEPGEQCDEGSEQNRKCCEKCKLRPNAVCSDDNDACCKDCQVIKSKSTVCFTPSFEECLRRTYCDGIHSKCPPKLPKPDDTPCSYKGKCLKGECLSLCPQYKYESCSCDTMIDGCKWCCRKNDGQCSPLIINGTFENLPPGMLCIGGMCDRKGICQPIVGNFVARLFEVLDLSTPASFVKLMENNIVPTIIVLSLLIWIPGGCYVCYLDRRDKRERLKIINETVDDVLDGKESARRQTDADFGDTDLRNTVQRLTIQAYQFQDIPSQENPSQGNPSQVNEYKNKQQSGNKLSQSSVGGRAY